MNDGRTVGQEPHGRKTPQVDMSKLSQVPFDKVSPSMRREVYGVPYVELIDAAGGTLWVTRHGWPFLSHVDPAQWYVDHQLRRRGTPISEGSGAVYRVSSFPPHSGPMDLVVKFSRMAQDVPLQVSSQFPGGVPRHVSDEAVFNDPFQEFGLLEELRHSSSGPPSLRIRTKRPLAIYSPSRRFEPWQLGRTADRFLRYQRLLAEDQRSRPAAVRVELCLDRQYMYLFQWVRGIDAASLVREGSLSEEEAAALVVDVIGDLAAKGFRVLDTKPGHVILRKRPDGQLLRRGGRLAYALVDFELLQRTADTPLRRWEIGDY